LYFIKRKAKYIKVATKEKLSQANHMTKSRNKREKSQSPEIDPDEPTKPV
jgi:hypothetical protein